MRPAYWFPLLVCSALVVAGCDGGTAARTATTRTTPSVPISSSSVPGNSGPLHFARPVPVAPGAGLESVSCGSPTSCIALDRAGRAYVFNGTGWTGPEPAAAQPIGAGAISVSCSNPAFCLAVATAGDQVISWDGQAWSVPVTVEGANSLEAVGCAPTGYCAAVDAQGNAFAYSGGSWSGTSGDWGSVSAISCVSSSFCVSASGGISQWNGSQWTMPDSFSDSSSFAAVSCPTASFCTAVDESGGSFVWNGLSWSGPVPIEPGRAAPTTIGVTVTGISCPSNSYCAATDDSGGVLQWSSHTWVRADIDGGHHLTSVSCPSISLCVAVDQAGDAVVGRS